MHADESRAVRRIQEGWSGEEWSLMKKLGTLPAQGQTVLTEETVTSPFRAGHAPREQSGAPDTRPMAEGPVFG
ncbi:hypothetical protein SKAU_G00080540 [Synaphobranchus kaupii]|uniref:Uncharacterized protein n=1 Tax=Synaphobranchus kaupii TaxID=118154 RepID=A0A9Q1J5G1_SYNKA|nr:hypothetical protein SKAU_G00080540 [Synaphobranchus kaupii]